MEICSITILIFTLLIGAEKFNAMMDNTATIEGQVTRAMYGIPMNILFVVVDLLVYFIVRHRAKRIASRAENTETVE